MSEWRLIERISLLRLDQIEKEVSAAEETRAQQTTLDLLGEVLRLRNLLVRLALSASRLEGERMRKTKLVLVVILAALVGAGAALAGGAFTLSFSFSGQAPDTVKVQRSCYPGTLDAVYVARGTDAAGQALAPQLVVLPGACVRPTPLPPVTN